MKIKIIMDEYFYLTKYKRETIKTVLGRHLKEVLLMNSSRLMNQIKKSKKNNFFPFFFFYFFYFFFSGQLISHSMPSLQPQLPQK